MCTFYKTFNEKNVCKYIILSITLVQLGLMQNKIKIHFMTQNMDYIYYVKPFIQEFGRCALS